MATLVFALAGSHPAASTAGAGLVAVGSYDANKYSSNMGTLFLTHIAEVIARLLPRLEPAE